MLPFLYTRVSTPCWEGRSSRTTSPASGKLKPEVADAWGTAGSVSAPYSKSGLKPNRLRKVVARLAIQILPSGGRVTPAGRVMEPEESVTCHWSSETGAWLTLTRRTASSPLLAVSYWV